jgi:hypothetical protein
MSALSVQPGLPFTSYRAAFYADCDAGQLAKVKVRVREMNNGIVQIFMNGVHKKTLTKASSSEKGGHVWLEKFRGDGRAFEISTEFYPSNPKAPSSVILQAQLFNIQPNFEQCMDHTHCLSVMGNMKNKASYALRNKNGYQLSCLRKGTLPPFLMSTCEVWRSCVEKSPKLARYLLSSLSAANPSMLQVEATSVAEATRPPKNKRRHVKDG